MKTFSIKTILLGGFVLLVSGLSLMAQSPLPGTANVTRSEDGKFLQFDLTLNSIGDYKISTNEVLCLYVDYKSRDNEHIVAVDTLYIAGGTRYKVLRRKHNLKNERAGKDIAFAEVKRLSEVLASNEPIVIKRSMPFERWMAKGALHVREERIGCADCVNAGAFSQVNVTIPLFGKEFYDYRFITPKAVASKSYHEDFASYVNFVVARHELLPDYKQNKKELTRIDDFVTRALKLAEDGATLRQASVTGYASPEGEFEYNRALSSRRAQTLLSYVERNFPQLKRQTQLAVTSGGEDWAGLRKAVLEGNETWSNQVAAIIDKYDTDVKREADIKLLNGGAVYQRLLRGYYPPLRRTQFTLSFDVRDYTLEELPMIFDKKPELMSHHELFTYADHYYVREGKNPTPVYAVAYRIYPDDNISRLNYAYALMKYDNNPAEALAVLRPIADDKRALFPMAMALDMQGEYMAAEQLLKAAADAGDERAKRVFEVVE